MSLPLSTANRRYGRYFDNPYHPARKLTALRVDPAVVLPPKASTSQFMGPIYDQGNEGKCTGEMGAEIRDMLYRRQFKYEKDQSVPADQFSASPDFMYLLNLIADGMLGNDAGSSIHQTFINLNRYGCCLQSQATGLVGEFSTAPTPAQYSDALKYKGGAYHFIPDLQTLKACIAGKPDDAYSQYSVGGGILVYDSFEGSQLASTGFMPMPATNESLLGGHAQHFMDYDDTIKFPDGSVGGVLVQNSWGSQWGLSAPGRTDRGCYWMPYAFFSGSDPSGNGAFVNDMWMIHLGKSWG